MGADTPPSKITRDVQRRTVAIRASCGFRYRESDPEDHTPAPEPRDTEERDGQYREISSESEDNEWVEEEREAEVRIDEVEISEPEQTASKVPSEALPSTDTTEEDEDLVEKILQLTKALVGLPTSTIDLAVRQLLSERRQRKEPEKEEKSHTK